MIKLGKAKDYSNSFLYDWVTNSGVSSECSPIEVKEVVLVYMESWIDFAIVRLTTGELLLLVASPRLETSFLVPRESYATMSELLENLLTFPSDHLTQDLNVRTKEEIIGGVVKYITINRANDSK